MAEHLNRDDVERRLNRLREECGEFPVRWREETWSEAEFADSVELAETGYVGAAHVLATREPDQTVDLSESMPEPDRPVQRRVLLAMGRGSDVWGPPGGGREQGETYEEAAIREVDEEVGVDVSLTDVREVLRWTTTAEGDDRTVHTAFVLFDGEYEGGHIDIQPEEMNGACWFRELPPNLHDFAQRFAQEWEGGRVSVE
jgi:8-oxo-dGTP diphosphatase